jgi:GTP pyrophosphokinase
VDGREIYEKLINIMRTYHPSGDFSAVFKAYETAAAAHASQKRKSGEPYIVHPLEVAVILAQLEMDRETIVAAILHDVIEDVAGYTYATVADGFGEEVAGLVDGVTKLTNSDYIGSRDDEQAENYRKMFLAISTDIRVIIIKIADRLHNLRTLEYMSPEKRKRKAQETLDIYAPLAHRLGISKLRVEMEDLAFRYAMPEEFAELGAKISKKQSERDAFIQNIVEEIKAKIESAGIDGRVEGRPKHFFSIYKKMVGKRKALDEIFDLFALRVIVKDIQECYSCLGIIHEMYKPMPDRFKDYIAMPKQNGYQSLHTSLMREGEPFEAQIRTEDMHRQSEYGVAAHWKYKEGRNARNDKGRELTDDEKSEEKLTWLRQILELQRDMADNGEYVEALKFDLNVYQHHVYVFSPKGKVVSLAVGATPVDYAYAIHSAIGNMMVGAKINGKIVPFETALNSGDRVEILTSQNSRGPSRDWLKFVKTSQAKSKIRQWFKKEDREASVSRGKEALEKAARQKGAALSELTKPTYIKIVLNRYSLLDWEAVCAAVGRGIVREGNIINRIYEEWQKDSLAEEMFETARRALEAPLHDYRSQKTLKGGVIVKDYGAVEARFPKCCGPMPGDEIVAYVTRGNGVTVHRTDCPNILHMPDLERARMHEAEWAATAGAATKGEFAVDVAVTCDRFVKTPTEIISVLAAEGAEMRSINRAAKQEDAFACGMKVSSKEQYEKVCQKLMGIPYVVEVSRITG